MARPGFVLEVDDRTPPLIVPNGDGFQLEKFPLGTRVIYPAESLPALVELDEAISGALDRPGGSEPLSELLKPGMKLTIAFDDITVPTPKLRKPDLRGKIIEAVLTRAAKAGVDDVALVAANGLHRRMTASELQHLLGERVFRSFYADGLLTNHDAEDTDNLTRIGETAAGEVMINSRAAQADLLIFVHLVIAPRGGGASGIAAGLGSAATIAQLSGIAGLLSGGAAAKAVGEQVGAAIKIFQIEAVLDNDVFSPSLEFLGKREWEWNLREQATWLGVRRALAATPAGLRRRIMNGAEANYHPTLITGGAPGAVQEISRSQILAQQVVDVDRQADVGVIGVGSRTPYSADSVTNPILAAWLGLGASFQSHTGKPFVREGGALVVYHPLGAAFSPLHHPSYVDFFADVLSTTTDPMRIQSEFEKTFATDPWYIHLYRTSQAFHGVHPIYLWYQIAGARMHCSDIVWVGADRSSVERMGFRAASTLADALEMVSSTVGRSPSISYLHTPPQIVVNLT